MQIENVGNENIKITCTSGKKTAQKGPTNCEARLHNIKGETVKQWNNEKDYKTGGKGHVPNYLITQKVTGKYR